MVHFFITIAGVPEKDAADTLWREIARPGVNFTVLDRRSYIYGNASNSVVDTLLCKAAGLGFAVELERG